MRGLKTFRSTQVLLATTLLAFGTVCTLMPAANAQVVVSIGIQPVCTYGYYDYAPYACAPVGFYGSGYFYNGIFLGMGPWAGWGYGHGWGGHRFNGDGGGRYHGGGGEAAGRAYERGEQAGHASAVHTSSNSYHGSNASHAEGARPPAGHPASSHNAPHAAAPHETAPHAAAPHGGGEPHGSGGEHK